MSEAIKRSTFYLDLDLHRALRMKSAHTGRSMSELVNEAVRYPLQEDREDLAAFKERARELEITYEALLQDLSKHGKI